MKHFFSVLVLFAAMTLIVSFAGCPQESEDDTPDTDYSGVSALEFASLMRIGWNLGNTLDAHNNMNPRETAWGNQPAAQELINTVAAQGFGAVRIPVTWGNTIGSPPEYTIDSAWLDRVAEVVEYVRSAEMIAIINIHHDGADSGYWLSVKANDITGVAKDNIDAKFSAVWKQIAAHFKNTGNFLVFEGFNELHDGSWGNGSTAQRNRVNELNQIFVDAVRSTGGRNIDRFLVVSGWVTRPSLLRHLVMPADSAQDKLIANFHYYDPYDFSGSASWNAWGSKANPSGSRAWANESYVQSTFDDVKTRFIDKGIPVIIGEYGAVRQATETGKSHRLYYMEYVTKYAIDCGFIPFYWDNGGANAGREGFGLFNRRSPYGLLSDTAEVIAVMMKAVNEDYPLPEIPPP